MMNRLFSSSCSGSEVANFVVSSGLLKLCWDQILDCYKGVELNTEPQTDDLGFSLRWKACQQPQFNIIAFVTNPVCTKFHLQQQQQHQEAQHLVKDTLPLLEFLFSYGNSFSIHKAAITLFAAHINQLSQLKHQAQTVCSSSSSSIPLIITGHSLGGSIASLFTLWLLQGLDVSASSIRKRPLCLTFGSPLVGDKAFQHAISQHPAGNSCFLHVAAREDSIPGLFIADHHTMASANPYKPFGTFLLCCEMGCTCSNDPETISELLVAMGLGRSAADEEQPFVDYGMIVEQLESLIIIQGMSKPSDFMSNPIQAGAILQLQAIGLQKRQHQQQQNSELDILIKRLEKLEETCMLNKRKIFDPAKKLNDIKVKMALLEWYKKVCKAEEIGYYDSYKNQFSQKDREIIKHKKFLTNYWKEIVSEIERNPQRGKMYLRKRWLYSGATYRRMFEPLDIAEYYKSGKRNYITNGRSEHYIKMEKWLDEADQRSGGSFSMQTNKPNVDAILTEDSCFWAHVEEARLWCKTLGNSELDANNISIDIERETSRQKLMNFEAYVMEQINKSSVSSEIFLKGSSFMQWWKEYDKIVGPYHNLPLSEFMRNCKYQQYASGCLALEKFIRY